MTYHMGLDIRGALLNWKDRDFKGLCKGDNGEALTPREARIVLMDELSKGHNTIPFGNCDNWDFKTGCKGHPEVRP